MIKVCGLLIIVDVKLHGPNISEPNSLSFVFWFHTQRSLFRSSQFELRGLKYLVLGSDSELTI